tara:strand:- start:99 stop:299 length:201 start_codon:yes stop_codon:yes gene_type:complete
MLLDEALSNNLGAQKFITIVRRIGPPEEPNCLGLAPLALEEPFKLIDVKFLSSLEVNHAHDVILVG